MRCVPSAVAIRCRALTKRYGTHLAVAGIELEIPSGECFGLLGPNGAGKTTTVEMLEGLTPADSGEIELFGSRWGAGRDDELKERFGVQLQDNQLADKLLVEEVFTLFRSFYRKGKSANELLALLDLESVRRVGWVGGSRGHSGARAGRCA
jgi:ABC-2 type transport system ATP-binding protein